MLAGAEAGAVAGAAEAHAIWRMIRGRRRLSALLPTLLPEACRHLHRPPARAMEKLRSILGG